MDRDVDLLARLRAGDESAFLALVATYQQPMLRLARTMVPSPAAAEDVVQETWIGVLRGIDGFEGRSSFRTWLFRILVNRARSTGSRERAVASVEKGPAVDPSRFGAGGEWREPVVPWEDESADRLDAAKLSPVLRDAIEQLPARQRQVVILRDVEGLSGAEVSEILGVSAGNQRILLHRGRSRLRDVLDAAMRRR